MRLARRIFFYLFAAAYLVGCPFTIAYALGYLYQPGTERGIVQTGLISIATAPPGATVYLNNKRYTRKTPALLRGLLPGTYQVRVALRDHRSWTRSVTVEGAKASAFEHVLLPPDAWRPAAAFADPFDQLVPLAGDRFALLLSGETLGTAMVWDARQEQARPLLPVLSPWRQARLIDDLPVAGAPAVLARVEVRGAEHVIWVEVRAEETAIEDLSLFLLSRPVWAMAQPNGRHRLVLFDDGALVSVDEHLGPVRLAEGVRGAGLAGRWVYVLRESGALERMDMDGHDRETLLHDPELAGSLFGSGRGFFRILAPEEELLLFWGEQGRLLANRLPYRFARDGILGLAPDPARHRVLLWRRDAVGLLEYGPAEPATELFERGPRLRWLVKHLGRVEQAVWAYDGAYALFRDGDALQLMEMDPEAPAPPVDVATLRHKSAMLYAEATGTVYFLSADTGQLMRLALMPRRELLILPEAFEKLPPLTEPGAPRSPGPPPAGAGAGARGGDGNVAPGDRARPGVRR